MINPEQLKVLQYWMEERQRIHDSKEAGKPRPWSTDPIFKQYKFCNVKREDDRVTQWFDANWRNHKWWDHPNFIPAIMLGRTINWPNSLEHIGFPEVWDREKVCNSLDELQSSGTKIYTGAYMITAGPPGVRKNLWVTGNADTYFKNPPALNCTSIQRSWETIIENKYPCVGAFIAGQIIADLKHTDHLNKAIDWWTWAALGPGSARGLNRLHDRPLTNLIPQNRGLYEMREVREQLGREDLCMQDIQNCLCEFDKYSRVLLGQGKPRSGYSGS
jgi:hypothetical protein